MTEIIRHKYHACVGDIRCAYKLPLPVDEGIASDIEDFGASKREDLSNEAMWIFESSEGYTFHLRAGSPVLEIRFRRSNQKENLGNVEKWLKAYFKTEIKKEA